MRRYICLLAIAGMAWGVGARAQISGKLTESAVPVEMGRELPRTRTVSYPSRQAAMDADAGPSRYFAPLTEWTRGSDAAGNAVFSSKFKVPFDWVERRHFLHIGAATGSYVVIVNGDFVGYNQSGGTAAEFEVTAASVEGLNSVEVIVYKGAAADVLHRGGAEPAITGETYIVSQPRIRIRDLVANTNLEGDNNTLEFGVIVKSHLLNTKTVRVHYALFGPDGEAGPYGHRDADFEMKMEDTVRFFVYIPDARPWTHESPNIYTLVLSLQHEGRYTEYVAYRLGLRTFGMQEGEFTVNGRPVRLHMAEYAYGGDIATAERELRELRAGGINMIKVKGAPQPDVLYDLCDRVGLYVCNQADIDTRAAGLSRARGGNPSNDPQWEEAYVDRALAMYHTSKNHPSVAMFSLAENSANGYNLYESYLALKSQGDSRPVVYLDGEGEWNTDALLAALHRDYAEGLTRRVRLDDIADPDTEYTLPTVTTAPAVSDGVAAAAAEGRFHLNNNYIAAELRNPVVVWEVRQGKKVVSKGEQTIEEIIPAGGIAQFAVPYGKAKVGVPLTVEFTVYRPRERFDPVTVTTSGRGKNERPELVKLTVQEASVRF